MKSLLLSFFLIVSFYYFPAIARKTGYKLNVEKNRQEKTEPQEMSKGSFMVASQCEDCNAGYRLEQIIFSGYNKPRRSAIETFFITNNTDRHMSGVNLYIEYLTLDGRQLNKRFVKLVCDIPPGETRMAEVPGWDRQKAFYYVRSDGGKSGGTPYEVIFDPVSYYLRF